MKKKVTVTIFVDVPDDTPEVEIEKQAIDYVIGCKDEGEQYDDVNITVEDA